MDDECKVCKQDFVIEPGFYYGAMFISYILNVAVIAVGLLVFGYLFPIENPWILVGATCILVLLFVPLNFRLSRLVFLFYFGGVGEST